MEHLLIGISVVGGISLLGYCLIKIGKQRTEQMHESIHAEYQKKNGQSISKYPTCHKRVMVYLVCVLSGHWYCLGNDNGKVERPVSRKTFERVR